VERRRERAHAREARRDRFAFNLSTDLSLFRLIVPCGISEFGVGSVASLTGAVPTVASAAERALPLFEQVFGYRRAELESTSVAELGAELAALSALEARASLG
jgi:hypothetical protein